MDTTVALDPEAYQRAETLAAKRHQSIGKVVSDAVLSQSDPQSPPVAELTVDEQGFPAIRIGRPITVEEVRAAIEEDEEWEITRGDPNHPSYDHPQGEPVVTCGPAGLPEIRFGKPTTLDEVREAIKVED